MAPTYKRQIASKARVFEACLFRQVNLFAESIGEIKDLSFSKEHAGARDLIEMLALHMRGINAGLLQQRDYCLLDDEKKQTHINSIA